MDVHTFTLDNGLTVYLNEDHNTTSVFGAVVVNGGGKRDPHDATGIAHYLEHLLFKGTDELGTIDFEKEEYIYLLELIIYLEKIGFEIRKFGNQSIIVEGVPTELPIGKEKEIIQDILENYIENKRLNSSFIEYMAATYACKAAIKAGESLSQIECLELINKLFNTQHPYYCPHGRPIIVNLTIEELDKRFERH